MDSKELEEMLRLNKFLTLLHKKTAVTKFINWLIGQITNPETDVSEIGKQAKDLLDICFDESEFKKEEV